MLLEPRAQPRRATWSTPAAATWRANGRSRGIGPSDARRLAEGIPACTHCRPDSGLGYLVG
ncbi:DUF6233 domain-containing protein [Streptomyces sp. NPDC060002]|uniref:DUF6233 domain-containing protein n=1 Tax=Streptomyces sp. NPDC060002 TaxID=3347033 RepID=UPI0036AC59AC